MHLADQPRKENTQRVIFQILKNPILYREQIRRHKADYDDVKKTFLRAEDAFREQRDRNRLLSGASNFEVFTSTLIIKSQINSLD